MAHARTTRQSGDGASGAIIGSGARVRGRIHGDGDLTVEGTVDGDIQLRGHLVIAQGGHVTRGVEADQVTVAGALEGDINAKGAVFIAAGSRVRGDVHGEQIALEDGAEFAGRLDCDFELPPAMSTSGNAGHAKEHAAGGRRGR